MSALLHEPTFKAAAGEAVFSKARVINTLGNRAVHSHGPITRARRARRSQRTVPCELLARPHLRAEGQAGSRSDVRSRLQPATAPIPKQTIDAASAAGSRAPRDEDEQLTAVLADKSALDEELVRLRAEVAAAKKASAASLDTHDYSEAETRDYFIDLLLKEAGWALDQPRDREFEVTGMPNAEGKGFVDYVLWGDDGKPLGLVEAKRTKRSPRVGPAAGEALRRLPGGSSSGSGRSSSTPTATTTGSGMTPATRRVPVQGFFKKAELELLIQRRTSRKPLADSRRSTRRSSSATTRRAPSAGSARRSRRQRPESAARHGDRRGQDPHGHRAVDLLMRCNWVKRVLFLADRVALVKQAVGPSRRTCPTASPVNLVTEKDAEGRVFVSTYPTMMGLIDESHDGQRRFGVGHFDLVIIDEAHRSVYQKYRAIFDYFDSLLVGLTATPKDEIDHNTYGLFDLERGVPTDAYELDEAVKDGFLVPAKAVSVPLKFQREGITYDELSEEEKDQWDALEWDEDGESPDRVEAAAVNKWLFNKDTVDKVLAHLMTRGQKVAGGDRLGKTIIFAKNQAHAEFIAERFDVNYPHFKGEFARVIHFRASLRPEPDRRLLEPGQAAAHRRSRWTCSTRASTSRRSSISSSSSWSARRPSSGRWSDEARGSAQICSGRARTSSSSTSSTTARTWSSSARTRRPRTGSRRLARQAPVRYPAGAHRCAGQATAARCRGRCAEAVAWSARRADHRSGRSPRVGDPAARRSRRNEPGELPGSTPATPGGSVRQARSLVAPEQRGSHRAG